MVVQELTRQEQHGVRVRGGATGVGRQTGWSQRRCGGAAFPPHRMMQRRGLLLVPRWASGGVGGRRRGTTGANADGRRLGDAGGESSPTLGASSASVSHGCDERLNAEQRKKDSGAPLPGAPNVGYRVPAKPLRFELWGAREDLPPTDPRPIAS